jgi:hypothetical protein
LRLIIVVLPMFYRLGSHAQLFVKL